MNTHAARATGPLPREAGPCGGRGQLRGCVLLPWQLCHVMALLGLAGACVDELPASYPITGAYASFQLLRVVGFGLIWPLRQAGGACYHGILHRPAAPVLWL